MLAAGQFIKVLLPKHTRLVQKLVNKRRLAMVNVGNYRYITNIV
jgi:hypothetical protein